MAGAELTIGLMLAVAHQIAAGDRPVRAGQWPRLLGTELAGKRLGLIGLGAIGREVARRLQPFGMRLLAWSRHLTPEQAQACGAAEQGAPGLQPAHAGEARGDPDQHRPRADRRSIWFARSRRRAPR